MSVDSPFVHPPEYASHIRVSELEEQDLELHELSRTSNVHLTRNPKQIPHLEPKTSGVAATYDPPIRVVKPEERMIHVFIEIGDY